MPPKRLTEKGIYSEKQLLSLWEKHKKILPVSQALGVNRKTVRRHLLRLGITSIRPPGRPKGLPGRHHSSLIKWVKEHPTTPLPRSPEKIVALTGCSIHAVLAYLKRRRENFRKELASLPDLRQTPLKLKTPSGVGIPLRVVDSYNYVIDDWTQKAKLVIQLRGGKKLSFKIKSLKDFKKAIADSYQ
jgi:hypothetical protein